MVGYVTRDFAMLWEQPSEREFLLDLLQRTEAEPSLLGASPHLMAVGERMDKILSDTAL